jgi:hypothetical protein
MAPRNFMIEKNTKKVYLIDPDTFGFWIYGQKESDIKDAVNYKGMSTERKPE